MILPFAIAFLFEPQKNRKTNETKNTQPESFLKLFLPSLQHNNSKTIQTSQKPNKNDPFPLFPARTKILFSLKKSVDFCFLLLHPFLRLVLQEPRSASDRLPNGIACQKASDTARRRGAHVQAGAISGAFWGEQAELFAFLQDCMLTLKIQE